MNFTLWTISLRYLLAHKRQSLICIAGVLISVTMFLAMFAMMLGFREKFIIETVESSGHVIVNDEPRVSETPILERAYSDKNALLVVDRVKPRENVKRIKNPQGLAAKLRQMPGIVAVAPVVTGDAIATYGTKTMNLQIEGVDPEAQQRVTTIGEKLLSGDFGKLYGAADGVIIGRGVAITLGAGLGDSIMLSSSTGGRTYARIVGVFQTGVTPVDYSRVYMLVNNAQTLLDKKNVINRLTVRTDDYELAPAYAAQIEAISGYKTESWQESNSNFLSIFKIQDVITYIITGALMVVAAFGVLNILIMAVLERVNDIAILKSMGYTRRDITVIFLIQGLVIGLIGASLGMVAGKLSIELLRLIPIQMEGLIKAEGLLMAEHPFYYTLAFVASNLAVLIAAVYPARRAASADPVDVIRGAH
jgi:lipoprotein-releasing system permease protein